MKDLLSEKIPALLRKLKPDAKPLWGKMSAQHMVEHIAMAWSISNGILEMELMLPAEKAARRKQFTLVEKNPFPKDLRVPIAPEEPGILEFSNLEEAIQYFELGAVRFYEYFAENPDASPIHPILGALNIGEWQEFHAMHFQHHLSQFGLMPELSKP